MGDGPWPRIAGLRVVMSWPDRGYARAPQRSPREFRARLAGAAGVLLLLGGSVTIGIAVLAQQHAPQPNAAAAGVIGPATPRGTLSLRRSLPLSVDIPAISVRSDLLRLGVTADGAMQVPSLTTSAGEAAWYEYSATPGQVGTSVIEGHVDSYRGPAVFFRLGALRPGDVIDVRLADGVTAIFKVTGVRRYSKAQFPARIIYGPAHYAALRLITCGGSFDRATGHYLSSTVVFASLTTYRKASHPAATA